MMGPYPHARIGMKITEDMIRSDRHSGRVMTPLQEKRVREGRLESKPSDYLSGTEAQKRAGIARRKAEDLKIEKEVGG